MTVGYSYARCAYNEFIVATRNEPRLGMGHKEGNEMNNVFAAASYANRAEYIAAKLAEIQVLLAKHAERAAAKPGNWGFAGDLEHVAELLDQTANFLGA